MASTPSRRSSSEGGHPCKTRGTDAAKLAAPASALTAEERRRVARRFERLSAGTGRLSFTDFAATELGTPAARRIWEVLTAADPDGELGEAELVAALTGPARPATPADRAAFLFTLLDRDGDGRLGRDELAAAMPRSVRDPDAAAGAALEVYAAQPEAGLSGAEFAALLAAGEGGRA